MNSTNSCRIAALKDISRHIKEQEGDRYDHYRDDKGRGVHCYRYVGWNELDTKEVRRMNREVIEG